MYWSCYFMRSNYDEAKLHRILARLLSFQYFKFYEKFSKLN